MLVSKIDSCIIFFYMEALGLCFVVASLVVSTCCIKCTCHHLDGVTSVSFWDIPYVF